MPTTAIICDACIRGFSDLQEHEVSVSHHGSVESLRRAQAQGCAICLRLKPRPVPIPNPRENAGTTLRSWVPKKTAPMFGISNDLVVMNCTIERVHSEKDRLLIPYEHSVPDTTAADHCFDLVRMWMEKCSREHNSCARTQRSIYGNYDLPTLLVDIKDGLDHLCIVDGRSLPPETLYATLSHRWGQLETRNVLTENNIQQWRTKIPHIEREKTLSDAIQVAQRLGYSYMWIDMWCIMQDSPQDWRRECSRMSSVYKFSGCNIAAASAMDSIDGCFFERDLSLALPIRLQFSALGMGSFEKAPNVVAVIPIDPAKSIFSPGFYDIDLTDPWQEDIKFAPINRRGWVLQERLLAPRVLNFTKNQIYWECQELQASEAYPFGQRWHSDMGNIDFKSLSPFKIDQLALGSTEDLDQSLEYRQRKAAFVVWGNAVFQYTRFDSSERYPPIVGRTENLTNPEDKLVAISAIAREIRPYMRCKYLAGLWREFLIEQLAWSAVLPGYPPNTSRAPSWSWASTNAVIYQLKYTPDQLGYRGSIHLAEIVDVHVELSTDDEMGQVKKGSLLVRGRLLAVDIRALPPTSSNPYQHTLYRRIVFNGRESLLGLSPDIANFLPVSQYFLLPITFLLSKDNNYLGPPGINSFHGLLLQKSTHDRFSRVGHVGSSGYGTVKKEDLASDPILGLLGSWEWDAAFEPSFTPKESDLEVLEII